MRFQEIIGQEEIKKKLSRSVTEQRVSHAQLFSGPEGSGALALALAYAQYLGCSERTGEDSCGKCPSCLKHHKMIHPDLHYSYPVTTSKDNTHPKSTDYITQWRQALAGGPYVGLPEWYDLLGIEKTKQGIITVEESSDILRKLSMRTVEAEYKTVIIWMPEKMNVATQNKLLKVLEEPPDKTLFLLVSENADQLLPTILSRVQLIKINKITDEEMKGVLIARHRVDPETAKHLARLAEGNYTEALRMIGQSLEEGKRTAQEFIEWMRSCYKRDVVWINSWVEEIARAGRETQKRFLQHGLQVLRDCLLLSYSEVNGLLRISESEMDLFGKLSKLLSSNNAFDALAGEFNKAYFHIERNANAKILFMDLSLRVNRLITVSVR